MEKFQAYQISKLMHKPSFIANLGVLLSVMILIVTTSVVNGFEKELTKLFHQIPHVVLSHEENHFTPDEIKEIKQLKYDVGLIEYEGAEMALIKTGEVKEGEMLIGEILANKINAQIGDEVSLTSKEKNIYQVKGFVFGEQIIIKDLEGEQKTEITLNNPFNPKLEHYQNSWKNQFGYVYEDIKMVKFTVSFAMFLVMLITSFNIASTLMMEIKQKQKDIAILRTQGARKSMIRNIFLCYGLQKAIKGLALGTILGLIIAYYVSDIMTWLENKLNYHFLSKEFYYIDFLPSEIKPVEVLMIILGVILIVLLTSWIPARNASNIDPVKTLNQH